jgi:hypothetical protein
MSSLPIAQKFLDACKEYRVKLDQLERENAEMKENLLDLNRNCTIILTMSDTSVKAAVEIWDYLMIDCGSKEENEQQIDTIAGIVQRAIDAARAKEEKDRAAYAARTEEAKP